jgi:hypothetical protein
MERLYILNPRRRWNILKGHIVYRFTDIGIPI